MAPGPQNLNSQISSCNDSSNNNGEPIPNVSDMAKSFTLNPATLKTYSRLKSNATSAPSPHKTQTTCNLNAVSTESVQSSHTSQQPSNKKIKISDNSAITKITPVMPSIHPDVQLHNRFEPLASDMEQDSTLIDPQVDTLTTNEATTPPRLVRTRMPPITVKKLPEGNFFAQNNKLQSLLSQPVKISYSKEGIKYYTACRSDYDKLYSSLQNENIEFYSHEPREAKLLQIVVKRLPTSVDSQTLREELEKLNFSIQHVRQMSAPHQQSDGTHTRRPLPVWVVTLPNNELSQTIYQLKDINHHLVKIESYKSTPHIIQCHKCQGFGHTSKRCNIETHCVKCGQNHFFSDCPSKGPMHPPKCINCQGQHTASYGQCPIQKEQRAALQHKLREKQNNFTAQRQNNFTFHSSEFPNLQKPRQNDLESFQNVYGNADKPQLSSDSESLTESLKEIVAMVKSFNLKNILRLINSTLQRFSAAKDPLSKMLIILEAFSDFTQATDGP